MTFYVSEDIFKTLLKKLRTANSVHSCSEAFCLPANQMPIYLIIKICEGGQLCQLVIKNNLSHQFCIKIIYNIIPQRFVECANKSVQYSV